MVRLAVLVVAFVALSVNLTVRTRAVPAAKSDCRAAFVAVPETNVTELAVFDTDAVMAVGLNDAPSISSSAVPPADPTCPTVMSAPTLNEVLVAFSASVTVVPSVTVNVRFVGALGAVVSTVKVVVPLVVALFPAASGAVTATVTVPFVFDATVYVKYPVRSVAPSVPTVPVLLPVTPLNATLIALPNVVAVTPPTVSVATAFTTTTSLAFTGRDSDAL
jgi:hypothetical protein